MPSSTSEFSTVAQRKKHPKMKKKPSGPAGPARRPDLASMRWWPDTATTSRTALIRLPRSEPPCGSCVWNLTIFFVISSIPPFLWVRVSTFLWTTFGFVQKRWPQIHLVLPKRYVTTSFVVARDYFPYGKMASTKTSGIAADKQFSMWYVNSGLWIRR